MRYKSYCYVEVAKEATTLMKLNAPDQKKT